MDAGLIPRAPSAPIRAPLPARFAILVLAVAFSLALPRPHSTLARSLGGTLTEQENFGTLTFTPDGGGFAVFSQTYSSPQDFSGAFLHFDLYTDDTTLGWPGAPYTGSPAIKLVSNGQTVLELGVPIRVGEWTGVNIDLSNADQTLLANIDTIDFYVKDANNPGKLTYKLDDLYVSKVALPPRSSTSTLIVLGLDPGEVNNYELLDGPQTHFAFRTREYGKDSPDITTWDASQTPYYFTSASSDFVTYDGKPLYEPPADVQAVVDRPAAEGLYLHEVVAYLAASSNWNWAAAVSQLNWGWMDQIVTSATNAGKRVVWSEPAEAWEAISANGTALAWLSHWGVTIVPMFATNFQSPSSGYHMTVSRDYGSLIAGAFGMYFGESHQSWHFSEQDKPITRDGSAALARLGDDQNASYYEFEAPAGELRWSDPYMQGVSDFANWLNSR